MEPKHYLVITFNINGKFSVQRIAIVSVRWSDNDIAKAATEYAELQDWHTPDFDYVKHVKVEFEELQQLSKYIELIDLPEHVFVVWNGENFVR